MRIRGWGATDVGRRRDHNEDRFLCNDRLGLYAVADGMGGHLGGERASRMATEIIEASLMATLSTREAGTSDATPLAAEDALRAAIVEADRRIYETSAMDPAVAGMGTTLTALLFFDRRAYLGHVGDSRAYLYRDGRIRQLTDDHSWIQDQVRAGLLSPTEARESRYRNIITRSVGFEPTVSPDLQDLHPQAGDCFVLCSDGLSNDINVEEIGQVLTTDFYRDAPRALIAMANERGGDDNITCVCVHVAND
ncbi:MAG TPA: Stp1/IreP family PP2C-type Ser/Thr phosphatase [Polyangia bacterium]|jgi:protein phosphatase